jgi:hypothetical protein
MPMPVRELANVFVETHESNGQTADGNRGSCIVANEEASDESGTTDCHERDAFALMQAFSSRRGHGERRICIGAGADTGDIGTDHRRWGRRGGDHWSGRYWRECGRALRGECCRGECGGKSERSEQVSH